MKKTKDFIEFYEKYPKQEKEERANKAFNDLLTEGIKSDVIFTGLENSKQVAKIMGTNKEKKV